MKRSLQATILLLVCVAAYLASFRLFMRSHMMTSIVEGHTSTYIGVADTRLNRLLVTLYQPVLRYTFPAGTPLKWF